jgi:peptidoglycan L-alanyl-D-glutamate endopeptidase CwlK
VSLKDHTRQIQRIVGTTPDGVWGPVTARAVLEKLYPNPAPDTGTPELIFDARTEDKLRSLLPEAADRFRPFIAEARRVALVKYGCDYVAISGHRTWETQDLLYDRGRTSPGAKVTNARGGYSNHNFGIALDFGVFRNGKYLDSDDPSTAAVVHRNAGAIASDFDIEWGGDWTSFKDFPHFEIPTGLTMAQKRAQWAEHGKLLI